jgi:scyllo-inositol 2-dehydrogenase (NADP+)
MSKTYKAAVIGYGPAFNMGKHHIDSILANEGFTIAGICDGSPERAAAAKKDYPQAETFTDAEAMLAQVKPDLVTIITPHNTHAPLALKALNGGAHVVVEKPMAITTDEVKAMLAAAKANNRSLSTFHNRRWDADFVVLRDLVRSGIIGKIFRVEAGFNGYNKQGTWWRSNKVVSGGAIYDWGAHFTDWILNVVPSPIAHVTGFQVKHPDWNEYSNEDHSEYTITFTDGCLATLTISNLSMVDKPRWIVRGHLGSIVAANDHFVISRQDGGRKWTTTVRFDSVKSDWHAYYRNVCAHIKSGEPLVITPESAGRVISVLDSACQSAAKGGQPVVPFLA